MSKRTLASLNLSVDIIEIKFFGDYDWLACKRGPHRLRQNRKVHLAMDSAKGDIRGVEFPSRSEGDRGVMPQLLNQIPPDKGIGTVMRGGACDRRR